MRLVFAKFLFRLRKERTGIENEYKIVHHFAICKIFVYTHLIVMLIASVPDLFSFCRSIPYFFEHRISQDLCFAEQHFVARVCKDFSQNALVIILMHENSPLFSFKERTYLIEQ